MPELPEVETVRRQLAERLVGARIVDVVVWRPDKELPKGEAFAEALRGKGIETIDRRGKLLLWRFMDGAALAVHLKMTGKLTFFEAVPAEPGRHERLAFVFERSGERGALVWSDVRRFGYLRLLPDAAAIGSAMDAYGPEPLITGPEALAAALPRRSNRSLKAVLLDQAVVAGVGNIYADEACFAAGLHPARRLSSIAGPERVILMRNVQEILERSVRLRGTSAHTYVDTEGKKGGFADRLQVYGRTGKPCPRCGEPIRKTFVTGRGTHACDRCQPPPRIRATKKKEA